MSELATIKVCKSDLAEAEKLLEENGIACCRPYLMPSVFVVFEIGETCPKKYVKLDFGNWQVRLWNSLVGWHDFEVANDVAAERAYRSEMVFVESER